MTNPRESAICARFQPFAFMFCHNLELEGEHWRIRRVYVGRVAARLLHKGTRHTPGRLSGLRVSPANSTKKRVDPTRLELVTSAMRGRRSPD